MRFDVVTLFPGALRRLSSTTSFVGRAHTGRQARRAIALARATSASASTGASTTRRTAAAAAWSCAVDVLVACMESLDADAPRGAARRTACC